MGHVRSIASNTINTQQIDFTCEQRVIGSCDSTLANGNNLGRVKAEDSTVGVVAIAYGLILVSSKLSIDYREKLVHEEIGLSAEPCRYLTGGR